MHGAVEMLAMPRVLLAQKGAAARPPGGHVGALEIQGLVPPGAARLCPNLWFRAACSFDAWGWLELLDDLAPQAMWPRAPWSRWQVLAMMMGCVGWPVHRGAWAPSR